MDVETIGYFWYYLPMGLGALLPILIASSKGGGSRLAWVGCLPLVFLVIGTMVVGFVGMSASAGEGHGWDESWNAPVGWFCKFVLGMILGSFFASPFARR